MAWTSCKDVHLTASVTWRCGCDPTDCSWTSRRLRCSGARWFAASIRFKPLRSTTMTPIRVVRDLGNYIDHRLTMQADDAKTVLSCFVVLWRIRNKPVLQSLIVSMVLTRLDYGSATLYGLPNVLVDRIQYSSASRLIVHLQNRPMNISCYDKQ